MKYYSSWPDLYTVGFQLDDGSQIFDNWKCLEITISTSILDWLFGHVPGTCPRWKTKPPGDLGMEKIVADLTYVYVACKCSLKTKNMYQAYLVGGFKYFYFHPYLGKWSNMTNIFQMG